MSRTPREVADSHFVCGDGIDESALLAAAVAFVIAEEEEFVLDDGAAEGGTELILTKNWLDWAEEIAGVGLVVAEEVVGAAVELIGTGLGDDVDGGTGVASLVGREEAGLDFELADRFDGGTEDDGESEAFVVVNAVPEEVVGAFAIAVGEDFTARAEVVWTGAGHDGAPGTEADAGDARSEGGELYEVASIEREVGDLALLDDLTDGRAIAFDERVGGADFDGFGDAADLKLKVESGGLVDFETNVLEDRLEAGFTGIYLIAPRGQENDSEDTIVVSNYIAGDLGVEVLDCYFSGGNGGPRLIGNGSGNGRRVLCPHQ